MIKELSGQIERITFSDEENGYTVAKVLVSGQKDLITVVGNLMAPVPGTILKMKGEWFNHPKFGDQFKVLQYRTEEPLTYHGIRKYLGSGLIKGIGPVMADRIVKEFGQDTLNILEHDISKLVKVEGIGKKRVSMIKKAWNEQKEVRDLSIFLHSHNISASHVAPIFKTYGLQAKDIIRANPYKLATDILGIGFMTADQIANKLHHPKDSGMRLEAGILYTLKRCSDEGHVFYPYDALIQKSQEILSAPRESIASTLEHLSVNQKIIIEDIHNKIDSYQKKNKAVYLPKYNVCEKSVAQRLKALQTTPKTFDKKVNYNQEIQWVQSKLSITLVDTQIQAVKYALQKKVMIITGGPGTGKTTIIHAILKIYSKLKIKFNLAAPTGRAAKRMGETTGLNAKTIHRLLSYSYAKGGFQKNEKNPLDAELIVIDEVSMIDVILMHHLLKAIPEGANLILVGDVNQLPSVGAGNVLNDIIRSGMIPLIKLTEIFRQAKKSQIVLNAHRINNGDLPLMEKSLPGKKNISDFYFIDQENPKKVLNTILELVKIRIPRRFGFDPFEEIQVLTPMHRGLLGAGNLNEQLQNALNPEKVDFLRQRGRSFRINDKVMQIRNNYDKEVFNGDIGRIKKIDPVCREMVVIYVSKRINYGFDELDEIVPAYAISIHKSQGSEYPAVVIPIMTQHYIILQRNLIYTAITRGQKLVVMIGTRKALSIGIKNNKTQNRYTYLRERLSHFHR